MYLPGFLKAGGVQTVVSGGAGSVIGDIGSSGQAFDGSFSQSSGSCAHNFGVTGGWLGKTFSPGKRIYKARTTGSNNSGYWFNHSPTTYLDLYGKQGAAPSGATDGTLIGTINFTDTGNESTPRDILSTDTVTRWDHVWVYFHRNDAVGGDLQVAEIEFTELA